MKVSREESKRKAVPMLATAKRNQWNKHRRYASRER